jgi:hypothetical protein
MYCPVCHREADTKEQMYLITKYNLIDRELKSIIINFIEDFEKIYQPLALKEKRVELSNLIETYTELVEQSFK